MIETYVCVSGGEQPYSYFQCVAPLCALSTDSRGGGPTVTPPPSNTTSPSIPPQRRSIFGSSGCESKLNSIFLLVSFLLILFWV